MQKAREITEWYDQGLIPSRLLQSLIELRRQSGDAAENQEPAKAVRYRPILHYLANRNLGRPDQRPVREWIDKLISRDSPDADASWRAMGFIARYAVLARREQNQEVS